MIWDTDAEVSQTGRVILTEIQERRLLGTDGKYCNVAYAETPWSFNIHSEADWK